jgi:hypothetical protein
MSDSRFNRRRLARSLGTRASTFKRRFLPSFRRGLEDPTVPLSLDLEHGSTSLLIAFGGIQGGLEIPPFEFFNATGGFPIKRLFIRDLRQAWYHQGVRGHGSSIDELADSLAQLIAPYDIERLVVTGTSMGGYAAILFGSLLRADMAIAFAPQTVLDRGVLEAIGDHRWDRDLDRVSARGGLDPRWLDLRRALPRSRAGQTRYEVLYDPQLDLDRAHCELLEGVPGVHLMPREGGGHSIARDMRDHGELEPLLRNALLVGPPDSSG